tara:strand:- start:5884 stop:6051 length:168 start_codon:yes stop_codon:yes gene_type:complete
MASDLKIATRVERKPAVEKLTPAQAKGRRKLIKKIMSFRPMQVASGALNNPLKKF